MVTAQVADHPHAAAHVPAHGPPPRATFARKEQRQPPRDRPEASEPPPARTADATPRAVAWTPPRKRVVYEDEAPAPPAAATVEPPAASAATPPAAAAPAKPAAAAPAKPPPPAATPAKPPPPAAPARPPPPVAPSTSTPPKKAKLACYGRPPAESDVVYWSDAPALPPDTLAPPRPDKYLTFEYDAGGWNNIRMGLECLVVLGHAMRRTVVLPPPQPLCRRGAGLGDTVFYDCGVELRASPRPCVAPAASPRPRGRSRGARGAAATPADDSRLALGLLAPDTSSAQVLDRQDPHGAPRLWLLGLHQRDASRRTPGLEDARHEGILADVHRGRARGRPAQDEAARDLDQGLGRGRRDAAGHRPALRKVRRPRPRRRRGLAAAVAGRADASAPRRRGPS